MQGNWRQKYLRYKNYLLNTVDRYEERADVRVYLEILLSLITISIFSVFALRPTLLTIAELIKEIEAKESLVQQLDNKIDTINTAQILYDRERQNIELLKKSISQEAQTDLLIYQLEGLVEKNGVTPINLTINETILVRDSTQENNQQNNQQKEAVQKSDFIDFNFQVRGDYIALYSFVNDIETLLRPIRITNSSITINEDEKTEETYLLLRLGGEMPYYEIEKQDQVNSQ